MAPPTKAARVRVSASRDSHDPRAPHKATGAVVAQSGELAAQELYSAFQAYNKAHFAGKLAAPLVLIMTARTPRTLGDYIAKDIHGLESRIRIAPMALKRGMAFALDVLLHEMVHAWQEEIDGNGEDGYRGHGPRFAYMCNKIGAQLGLPPVGVKGRDGLPDCKHWPENVRPAGYYPEPFVAPTRKKPAPAPEPEESGDSEPAPEPKGKRGALGKVLAAIRELPTKELQKLHDAIGEELAGRDE